MMIWIYNSVSPRKLKLLCGNTSTHVYWITLARKFQDKSNSNLIESRRRLQMMRKDNLSMEEYIEKVKELFDLIEATGDYISTRE